MTVVEFCEYNNQSCVISGKVFSQSTIVSADGTVAVQDLQDGLCLARRVGALSSHPTCLAVLPEQTIAVAGHDFDIEILQLDSMEVRRKF